jgi:hypothetical protein
MSTHKAINLNKVECGDRKFHHSTSNDNLVTCNKCKAVMAAKNTKFKKT